MEDKEVFLGGDSLTLPIMNDSTSNNVTFAKHLLSLLHSEDRDDIDVDRESTQV